VHQDADGDGPWIPFFSLRFYTYFFASFGFAGLLLTFLTKTDPILTTWLSAGLGLVTGLTASYALRLLKGSESSGAANEKDMIGKEGQVMVPIRGSSPGRIRCNVRGDIIDFLAVSGQERALEVGETVIVVSMEDGRANVVSSEGIFDELPAKVS
jgi:membrane protein implicated in regulation of membrane protease activity